MPAPCTPPPPHTPQPLHRARKASPTGIHPTKCGARRRATQGAWAGSASKSWGNQGLASLGCSSLASISLEGGADSNGSGNVTVFLALPQVWHMVPHTDRVWKCKQWRIRRIESSLSPVHLGYPPSGNLHRSKSPFFPVFVSSPSRTCLARASSYLSDSTSFQFSEDRIHLQQRLAY